jgi:hypothetical protein
VCVCVCVLLAECVFFTTKLALLCSSTLESVRVCVCVCVCMLYLLSQCKSANTDWSSTLEGPPGCCAGVCCVCVLCVCV